jgi:hypothetical protein
MVPSSEGVVHTFQKGCDNVMLTYQHDQLLLQQLAKGGACAQRN